VLGQVLDAIAAVAQDALVAVDKGVPVEVKPGS
jgi:hypothetical protein